MLQTLVCYFLFIRCGMILKMASETDEKFVNTEGNFVPFNQSLGNFLVSVISQRGEPLVLKITNDEGKVLSAMEDNKLIWATNDDEYKTRWSYVPTIGVAKGLISNDSGMCLFRVDNQVALKECPEVIDGGEGEEYHFETIFTAPKEEIRRAKAFLMANEKSEKELEEKYIDGEKKRQVPVDSEKRVYERPSGIKSLGLEDRYDKFGSGSPYKESSYATPEYLNKHEPEERKEKNAHEDHINALEKRGFIEPPEKLGSPVNKPTNKDIEIVPKIKYEHQREPNVPTTSERALNSSYDYVPATRVDRAPNSMKELLDDITLLQNSLRSLASYQPSKQYKRTKDKAYKEMYDLRRALAKKLLENNDYSEEPRKVAPEQQQSMIQYPSERETNKENMSKNEKEADEIKKQIKRLLETEFNSNQIDRVA